MNFILTKVRMILDMTPSYIMAWKKIDPKKYEGVKPIEMTSTEIKTAASVIKALKSVHYQRTVIAELMFTVTENSFSRLCEELGEELMNKILPVH